MDSNNTPARPADAVVAEVPASADAGTPRSTVKPPARRRRWHVVLGCLWVLPAISVVIYFYLIRARDRELQAVIAEIEAADPRWRFQDLLADRPPIADADNPALVVDKVHILLRPSGF